MSEAEIKIRKQLRFIRFLTAYAPLGIMRSLTRVSAKRARLPQYAHRESIVADGVTCDWIIPDNVDNNRIVLYLHGGGFVFGISSLHMEMVADLAQKMQAKILMVEYRLAPKHPFPAPLDDCIRVYKWLLKEDVEAKNIVIAGDSAGGNLTITTLMKLRDEGNPLPVAAVCLSPVADLVERDVEIKDPVLPPRAHHRYRIAYLADNDPKNPLISPIYGNWDNLPPILIHAGEDEILKEDALRIEEAVKTANTEIKVRIFPHMFHVWQIYKKLPETKESLNEIAEFLVSHLETSEAKS